MKFGFIGAGNMVSAIVKGMTANGYDEIGRASCRERV